MRRSPSAVSSTLSKPPACWLIAGTRARASYGCSGDRGSSAEEDPLRKGYRGRFGNYVPPLLERLSLAELEHNPRNNRVRAV
jgi:hypothetical protein